MMETAHLRCENCKHATEPQRQGNKDASWIEVVCIAPVPAWAEPMHDDTTTGHMAATRCPCYVQLPPTDPKRREQ
jgi:hypothetical protein